MPAQARIAVVGAGLMGHGIAQVFATHGHGVDVYDPDGAVLAQVHDRIRGNLRGLGEPESAVNRIDLCDRLAVAGA